MSLPTENLPPNLPNDDGVPAFETLALRHGSQRSDFGEHSDALFLTSSFVFESAEQAAARFANAEAGNIYTRFTNPTVTAFQDRLSALEGTECCIATGSGMAAIVTTVMALAKAGEHIVCSLHVFGSVLPLLNQIVKKFGVDTTWVASTDPADWQAAMRPNTRLVFLETPSNPTLQVYDIPAIAAICRQAGAVFVVDNCLATPALQRPAALGADLVIHSATKHIDGQGRVIAGAICGSRALVHDGGIYNFVRTAGPVISPFNAWVCLKGLETLALRMRAQSSAAFELAEWLARQPSVERVYYPFLGDAAQVALAKSQQEAGGALVSFEVKGGREAAFRVINSTRMISITGNLGDVRSTIIHPATTTHARLTDAERAAVGVGEGLVRLSVGLEAVADIRADLARGLG
jgi:O-succinylhomoserine sulfhydrylase